MKRYVIEIVTRRLILSLWRTQIFVLEKYTKNVIKKYKRTYTCTFLFINIGTSSSSFIHDAAINWKCQMFMKIWKINVKFVDLIRRNYSNGINYNDRVFKFAQDLSLYFKIARNTDIDQNEYQKIRSWIYNVLFKIVILINKFNHLSGSTQNFKGVRVWP